MKKILCKWRFTRSMNFKDDDDDGIGNECHHFKLLWRLFKGDFNNNNNKSVLRCVALRFQLKQLCFKRILLSEYIWANKSSHTTYRKGIEGVKRPFSILVVSSFSLLFFFCCLLLLSAIDGWPFFISFKNKNKIGLSHKYSGTKNELKTLKAEKCNQTYESKRA